MKKKLTILGLTLVAVIMSVMCVFTACNQKKDDATVEPSAESLATMIQTIDLNHKSDYSESTAGNYTLITKTSIAKEVAYIKWTVEVTTEGANKDDVKVGKEENNYVEIVINTKTPIELAYTLTATLTNQKGVEYKKEDGSLYTVSFTHTVPAYTIVNWQGFKENCEWNSANSSDKKTVTVKGYIIGIVSTTSSSKGSIYLQDENGYGYYAYKPTGIPADTITDDDALRAAWPVGTEIEVTGEGIVYSGQYEFAYGCAVKKTGNSIDASKLPYRNATEDWGKAANNKDTDLIPYQNSLVTLEGCKFTRVDGKYYYFTVNGVEFNIYNTNYFMDGTDVATMLEKYVVGKQATVKGLVSCFSNAYQIYPVGNDCISNVTDATFTAQEKIDAEASILDGEVVTEYTANATTALKQVGSSFSEVTIEWAIDKTYPGVSIKENALIIELQSEAQTIKLIATLSCAGAESKTKEFEISIDAAETVEYEPVAITAHAEGDFIIFMDTTNAEDGGSILYFDGTINDKGALVSTDKASKAAVVKALAVAGKTGVYNLKVGDKYLVGYLNGNYNNIKLDTTPGEWTWNDELKTFTCTFTDKNKEEGTFYFGAYTNSKYGTTGNTFALSYISFVTGDNASKVGVSQFVGHLGTLKEIEYEPVAITAPAEGTYKFFLTQAKLNNKVLYLDGGINSSEFLTSTEKASNAADVVLAKVDNGYTLKVGEKYIEIYTNSNDKVRPTLVDAATGAWTWNETLGIFTWTLSNKVYYIGTYNEFNTFSASETSYISGDNASKVGVSQFVGHLGTMQKKGTVVEKTDADKVTAEKAALSFTADTATVALQGTTYTDVTISWASDNAAIAIGTDGAVTISEVSEKTTVKVTATLTLGNVTQTAEFTVVLGDDSQQDDNSLENPYTIAQALEFAKDLKSGEDFKDGESFYFAGYVKDLLKYNSTYNSYEINLVDALTDTNVLLGYSINVEEDAVIYVGDKVTIYGVLGNYNGTIEIKQNSSKVFPKLVAKTAAETYEIKTETTNATVKFAESNSSSINVTNGSKVTFTIEVADNYAVKSVKLSNNVKIINQDLTATDGVYSFTVEGNMTVTVVAEDSSVTYTSVAKATFGSSTNQKQISSYSNEWQVKVGTQEWNIKNFNNYNNQWTLIKAGAKNKTGDASISTTFTDNAIKKIILNAEIDTTKVTLTSLVINVKNEQGEIIETKTLTSIIKGDNVIELSKSTVGCTYELIFNYVAKSQNGGIIVNSVEYFE